MLTNKPIIFDWVQDGENRGEPILKVQVFDYKLQVFKASADDFWSYRINSMGQMNIPSQKEAIQQIEKQVMAFISYRINKAKQDLALLTDFTFTDGDCEHDHKLRDCSESKDIQE